jgi:hypothetical protein
MNSNPVLAVTTFLNSNKRGGVYGHLNALFDGLLLTKLAVLIYVQFVIGVLVLNFITFHVALSSVAECVVTCKCNISEQLM